MSLAQGTIIPDTSGLISAMANMANQFKDSSKTKDEREKEVLAKISITQKTYPIISGRAKGQPLNELVPADRIASNPRRITDQEASQKVSQNSERAYESWFRD